MPSSEALLERIDRTAGLLRLRTNAKPEVGIILGTGLSGLGERIQVEHVVNYSDIPDFPVSTVQGHKGRFLFGKLGGKSVVAMQGRFHFYEGYSMEEVVRPVRIMGRMGIKHLFLSNACGGVAPDMAIGDLMILNDHLDLMPTNPLIGANSEALGTRFPDMSEPYDRKLIARAREIAARCGIPVRTGVYAALTGPCLETPAEYRMIRILGGDAVGMSTVPEVIAARHMGIPCFAMSVITDLGVEGKIQETTHAMVQRVAEAAEPQLTRIIEELIATC
ncbi:MAG: purine-nucleoside phosphorylase [Flavobacteriales bacterium]|nr:purine-nucleoside phosphorylase [Flavobacteriales bacterium]